MSLHPTSTDVLFPVCTLSCPVPLHFYQFLLFQVIFLPFFTILCCNFFMSHSFHVALCPRCTLFKVCFPCFCFFCFAGFWRCTWFMLHSFIIHSFHLAFFLKFHSFHVSLASCCSLSLLHFSSRCILSLLDFFMLHIFPATCCTLSSCIFLCCTIFIFHFFRVALFSWCMLSILHLFVFHFFHVAISLHSMLSLLHFVHVTLFSYCTLPYLHIFFILCFFMLFPCYALLKLHFFMLLKIKSSKIRVLLNSPTTDPPIIIMLRY